jgi:hypothetical protein
MKFDEIYKPPFHDFFGEWIVKKLKQEVATI